MQTFSIAQMKEIEKKATKLGVSYGELMEQAGKACAEKIMMQEYLLHKQVMVLCGDGNNGGDGFVLSGHLTQQGAVVVVVLCNGLPRTRIAAEKFQQLQEETDLLVIDLQQEMPIALFHAAKANIIIDSVFGTGFHGKIHGVLEEFFIQIHRSKAIKYAIDIPSGIHGDTGEMDSKALQVHHTLVLGGYKTAHRLKTVQEWCGEMSLLDIGIPSEAFLTMDIEQHDLTYSDLKGLLPKRNPCTHKGDYGKLLNIAGSNWMCGASMMSTLSALRCGVGLTVLASTAHVINRVSPHLMEATSCILPSTAQGTIDYTALPLLQNQCRTATACLIGCGLGQHTSTAKLVQSLMKTQKIPLILDADGINALQGDINIIEMMKAPMVITPHTKEFSRLIGVDVEKIEKTPVEYAYEFSNKTGTIVVLKGHHTVIATPTGKIYRNQTGSPALAKGGSGDVLAGMIASFIAQGFELETACTLAVGIHGVCGERCGERRSEYGVLARDLIEELTQVLREISP